MDLRKEIDRIGRDIAAMQYVNTVADDLKQVVYSVIDGNPGVGILMGMIQDAYTAGWIAGQEKLANEKGRADFDRCASDRASACG